MPETQYTLYAVGNALVDMEFALEDQQLREIGVEKGVMTLVDEAQHQSLFDQLYPTHGKRACGGSAANTLIATTYLGGRTYYTCKIADDEAGHFFLKDLTNAGVHTNAKETMAPGTTGKCLVMITPDAERTMNTFLGISADISEKEIEENAIKASEYVYLEGYLAGSPTGLQAAVRTREIAQANGVKTALTFSDPNIVNYCRPSLEKIVGTTPLNLVFCNEQEALRWAKTDDLEMATIELKKVTQAFAITLGAKGALIFDGRQTQLVPGTQVTAIDTNGAGDIFAGAFLYGINHDMSYFEAARLANLAAARLVQQYGPRLQPQAYSDLLSDFSKSKEIA